MSWRQDRYWVDALEAAMQACQEADVVLVPSEFLGLHERFMPLEYSWGLDPTRRRIAWCCTKDDAHRLAPWVHAPAPVRQHCAWSNEVFVLCAHFGWSRRATSASIRHWQAWRERVLAHVAGRSTRTANFRPAPGTQKGQGPRVLVVGASGMGNIGDDLLAAVLADLLRRHAGAQVWWSDSGVDSHQLKGFDAVVVGGGGLIYASRDGRNETQNLANYLKFGPMCEQRGLPVALIGVSDQDHAGGIFRDAVTTDFARHCLARFRLASTRDSASTELLKRLGLPDVRTGPDLLFGWAARARRSVRPTLPQPARLALIGELLDDRFVAAGLQDPTSPLARALAGEEIDLILMSEDDVAHAQRIRPLLRAAGAAASIQDMRGQGFEALVHGFSQYRGIVTTRFHGLVLAMVCYVPVLALDDPDGKKSRLLRSIGHEAGCLLASDTPLEQGVRRLAEAVQGRLASVPAGSVAALARSMTTHAEAIRTLLARRVGPHRADLEPEDDESAPVPKVAPLPPTPEATLRHRVAGLVRQATDDGGSVALCWAASTKETRGFGNLGDSLSAVMVSALSGRRVHHVGFERPETKLVAVGSIAHAIHRGEAVIWGSGVSIRGGILARNVPLTQYDVRAVRGRISARHLRDFGIEVPEVYGDPVWLLPSIFHEPVEKRYELGVIPHIQDIEGFGPQARPPADSMRYRIDPEDAGAVVLINTWHQPTWQGIVETLRLILSCKRIVSQSFHGVVIAEAYRIPVLNFRQMPQGDNGPRTISLEEDCTTDPRVWEFYRNGPRSRFEMYAQRRDERTDWHRVIRAVDTRWEPFAYDARALVDSFPLPLAYDPLSGRLTDLTRLKDLRF
jgi:polysaccharide pyruvyl transferase WcaK-like protein